ncbi:MAG: hypothetical protein MUE70_12215 [Desulfobacterales bacterium]|jgi:hypothetical protein|nr:hypothetical protein [Desulfobacterales bacterium]
MKKLIGVAFFIGIVMLFTDMAWAAENETAPAAQETPAVEAEKAAPASEVQEEKTGHGFGHKLLLYLPNRVLDIFDFARLRLRVGPGFAVGARATKPVSVFVGGYASVYAGLPGPRLEPTVKLPVGMENYGGVSVSVADATSDGYFGPNYSPTEIGAGFQLLIIGIDIGVDPVEVLDLATGFLFIDLRGDDL